MRQRVFISEWNAGKVIAKTEDEMLTRVRRAQLFLQGEIKRSINRGNASGKNPSAPGEPPKKVSNRLFSSIAAPAPTIEGGVITGPVGTNVEYARRLELGFVGTDSAGRNINQAPRPFLRPALANNLARLRKILGDGRHGARSV
jgi:hypothetical protein